MSHTPGPWYSEGYGGIQMDGISDGYRICSGSAYVAALTMHASKDRRQRMADANLIATAPDMLQFLKDLNNTGWDIDAKKGARIRELIARAEGTKE